MTQPTIFVRTEAQKLILDELQLLHKRLALLLRKIQHEATAAADNPDLTSVFLSGLTTELPRLAAEYQAFRQAAALAGCERSTITAVCQFGWSSIEVQDQPADTPMTERT